MGNASKAIIIAGGMLIAVLVISICMYMYASFKSMYAENMVMYDVSQKESFNLFFMQYPSKIMGYEAYNIIGKIDEVNAGEDSLTTILYNGINRDEEFYFTDALEDWYNYSYTIDSDGLVSYVEITRAE